MSQQSQSDLSNENSTLIAALQKYYANKTVMLDGKVWPVTDLVTAFTNENSAMGTVADARAAWLKATLAAKANRTVNNKLRIALRQFVRAQYGGDPQVLKDFGYDALRKAATTAITRVAAAAKASATRVARGTLGTRQRKAIRSAMTTSQALTAAFAAAVSSTSATTTPPSTATPPSTGTPSGIPQK